MSNNTSGAIYELLQKRDVLNKSISAIDNILSRKANVPHVLVQVTVYDHKGYSVHTHLPQDSVFDAVLSQRLHLIAELAIIDTKLGAIGSLLGVV